MKFISFKIRNFKGIKDLTVNLDEVPIKVITLIGLNESGKTTVLEALAFWGDDARNYVTSGTDSISEDPISEIDSETPLDESKLVYDNFSEIIPKNKQDNFTDEISVTATLKIEDLDKIEVNRFLREKGIKNVEYRGDISLKRVYHFKNSNFQGKTWMIDVPIYTKKTSRSKPKKIILTISKTFYRELVGLLLRQSPRIIYYPNFLFDFPEKIYLEKKENESKSERFYRRLFQDILDSLNNNLDLQQHIVERAKSKDSDQMRFLTSVLNKMSDQITKTVFNEKLSVFKGVNEKTINLEYPTFDEVAKAYYTRLEIKDGVDSYYIKERSLGFKWFFIFLLFTQFRIYRAADSGTIFLLDEPASNLHQTAQQRLLAALEKLTANNSSVVYTTHSHHLINPHWLEGAFIVKNKALSYEEGSDDEYDMSMTEISIERYRSFIGKYPNQRTYFQPILDVLDYRPSNLENIPDVVMVEGKTDFYYIEYFQKFFCSKKGLNILPGMGSGGLDEAIRLYYSWGQKFIILLDSDLEGQKQKQRYIDKFDGIIDGKVFTFGDIFQGSEKKKIEIEDFFSEIDLQKIDGLSGNVTKKRKKTLCIRIQELLAQNNKLDFSQETVNNFQALISFLEKTLSGLE